MWSVMTGPEGGLHLARSQSANLFEVQDSVCVLEAVEKYLAHLLSSRSLLHDLHCRVFWSVILI